MLYFVRLYEPDTLRLSNHTYSEHRFFGSVCKSFVKLGHHNGWVDCLASMGPKLASSVFPKDTTTHRQFGNWTGGQKSFDHWANATSCLCCSWCRFCSIWNYCAQNSLPLIWCNLFLLLIAGSEFLPEVILSWRKVYLEVRVCRLTASLKEVKHAAGIVCKIKETSKTLLH